MRPVSCTRGESIAPGLGRREEIIHRSAPGTCPHHSSMPSFARVSIRWGDPVGEGGGEGERIDDFGMECVFVDHQLSATNRRSARTLKFPKAATHRISVSVVGEGAANVILPEGSKLTISVRIVVPWLLSANGTTTPPTFL